MVAGCTVALPQGNSQETPQEGANSEQTLTAPAPSADREAPPTERKRPEAPDRIGDLAAWDLACEQTFPDADSADQCRTNNTKRAPTLDAALAELTQAYGGVRVWGRLYATTGLDQIVEAYLVEAESPGLWLTNGSAAWAEQAGAAHPSQWIESRGDVQCLMHTIVTVQAGQELTEQNMGTAHCQASGDGITVFLISGAQTPKDAFNRTQELFDHFR